MSEFEVEKSDPTLGPTEGSRRKFMLFGTIGLGGVLSVGTLQAGDLFPWQKAKRRIKPVCSVPKADYQFQARSPSIVIRSLPAVEQTKGDRIESLLALIKASRSDKKMIEDGLTGDALKDAKEKREKETNKALALAVDPKAKVLQLGTQQLKLAQFQLSDVTLLIEPSGKWQLSLRGDHSQRGAGQPKSIEVDPGLLRNAFNLRIRLLRSARNVRENLTTRPDDLNFAQASNLALGEIEVPEFWVQRSAPKFVNLSGESEFIETHFKEINQAEFEFHVRLDPLTGKGTGVIGR